MTHLEKSSSERKKSSSVIYHKVDTHGHNEGKITATKIQNKISEFFIMLPIVNRAEIDVFLELSCFFHDLADVGNLIWFLCLI